MIMSSGANERDEVVVTGLGATTPLGGDVATFWDGLLSGRSGVGPLTQEWAPSISVRIAAQMAVDPAEILEEIADVSPDDVTDDKSFTDDLDVDSLSMVEVVVAAEEKFGVKIPDDEVQNLRTVGDAVAYIEKGQA